MSILSQQPGLVKGSSHVAAVITLCLALITVTHSQSQDESSSEPLIAAIIHDGADMDADQTRVSHMPVIDEQTGSAVLPAEADEFTAVDSQAPANNGSPDLAELLMAAAADGSAARSTPATEQAQYEMAEFLVQKESMLENIIKLMQIKEELLASRIAFDQELARMEIRTRGQR